MHHAQPLLAIARNFPELAPKSRIDYADCDGMSSPHGTNWQSIRAINLPGKAWPQGSLAQAMLRGIGAAVYGASKGTQFLRDVASEVGVDANRSSGTSQRIADGLSSLWPVRPLQVGVLHADAWCAMLVASHGVMDTSWHELRDDEATTTREGNALDAMLRRDGQCMRLDTLVHPGREAALRDWSELAQRIDGRGFSHLFPLRQDCASLTLPEAISTDDSRLARLLIEAACLHSRHPARTDLGDRLAGRAANWCDTSEGHASLNSICTAMQAELEQRSAAWSPVREIAAQLLSQWAATSPTITQTQRVEVTELCARLLRDDAFATLRLAAVRFGQLDDAGGLDCLADAAHALKGMSRVHPGSAKPMTDQLPFLLAELESGLGHPLSLGRVAAGLTLTAATLSAAELVVFREDIRDELRFSSALMGKDQDRYLIEQVFGMLAEQAEGFASVATTQDEAPTLAFAPASRTAPAVGELTSDEVEDDNQPHGFLQLTGDAGRASNPWQALAASVSTASDASLRLTGAKARLANASTAKTDRAKATAAKKSTKLSASRLSASSKKSLAKARATKANAKSTSKPTAKAGKRAA